LPDDQTGTDARHSVTLRVNGQERTGVCEPRTTLADFLRDHLRLTGTHLGCEHGVCGACTVLVDGASARACLMLAKQSEGREITTIEGLRSESGELHPLQTAFSLKHGLQCGFCTPGMIMSACELLAEKPEPSDAEVAEHLSGNICRCTGYTKIIESVQHAAACLRATGEHEARA
jgi:aerobic-type carbon monoxide dehydrogenase small subunit (CoxS/CutS family)